MGVFIFINTLNGDCNEVFYVKLPEPRAPRRLPIGERNALVRLLAFFRRLVPRVQLHSRPAHIPLNERVFVPAKIQAGKHKIREAQVREGRARG